MATLSAHSRNPRPAALILALAALLGAAWLTSPHHGLEGLAEYLPLHSFVEGVSIVIAALVFGVVWNSTSRERPGNMVFAGCAFLAVALVDFVHVLSYPGMPQFVTPAGAGKSIYFWLAARGLAAMAFLAIAFWPPRPMRSPRLRFYVLAASLALAALIVWTGLFHEAQLPRSFVEGRGLTPFKVAAEWALIGLFAAAAAAFYGQARRSRSRQAGMLFAAAAISALSELSLTLYSTVTDVFTLFGHLYKVIAYAFLYRAVFVASVKEPYDRLRERERRLSRTEDIAQIGSWEADLTRDTVRFSDQALRIHGRTSDSAPPTVEAVIQCAHPDDRSLLRSAIHATLYEGKPFAIDYRLVRPDGSVRYVHAEDELVRGADGVPLRAFGILQDITERKRAEAALHDEQSRLALLTDSVPAMIAYVDAQGRYRYANLSYREFYGGSEAPIQGRGLEDVLLPETWREVRPRIEQALAGVAVSYAGERRTRDGGVRRVAVSLVPHREGPAAQVQGLYILALDVTAQYQAEQALRESEERYRSLIAAMAEGVVMQRADGTIAACNRSAERILGLTADQMLGRSSLDPRWRTVHEDGSPFPGEEHPAVVTLKTGRAQSEVTMGVHRPDKGLAWISINSEPLVREGESAPYAVVTSFHDITERKRVTLALAESERRYRLIFEQAAVGIAHTALDGHFLMANPKFCEMTGRTPEELLALDYRDVTHPDEIRSSADHRARLQAGKTRAYERELRLLRRDGSAFWANVTTTLVRKDGEPDHFISVFLDVSERKLAQERVARLTRVYAMLSSINGAIVRIRERGELFQEACRIAVESGKFKMAWIGLLEREAMTVKPVASAGEVGDFFAAAPLAVVEATPGGHGLVGRAIREKAPMVSNNVADDPQRLMKKELAARGINSVAVLPLRVGDEATGVIALYSTEVGFFDDEEMRLLLELAGDIGFALDHIEKEERISYLAYYDALTGLANRSLLLERLAQQLAAAGAGKARVALVLLNIERFKTVNDTLGRQAGDALLRQIAARLRDSVGEAARVARVGADQFALVLTDVRSYESLAGLLEKGHARVMGKPFVVEGRELLLSARSGVALFPENGGDAETLFRNAEAALKKARSGEVFVFYTQAMSEQVAGRLALETRLRQALERQEFVLHYQPKVEVESRRIVGAEALIRWQSPDRGLVPPLEFIPLLEETGLILAVGDWAMARAVEDHARWMGLGLQAPRIAVNVSPIQLRKPDFVASVERALARGAAARGIDLEITESLLMEDIENTIAKLVAVRALGVGVAIDDFGTGYSSLGYLARLPVQALKIDRSFVATMVENSGTVSLVTTIVSLAHSLRLKVIAEGVETEEQARHLRLLRCDEMQGYLIGRPVPADELERLLRSPRVA